MYQLDAVQVDTPPVMDGLVLEDSAWETATPATGFVQSTPNEGESASEKTEVRVIFTADTVYFGVVCYDKDPSSIIVRDSRRDSSMNEADSFQLVLDTFSDQQNGFVFGTTPAGQEYDGQVINEGGSRGGDLAEQGAVGFLGGLPAVLMSIGMVRGKSAQLFLRSGGVLSLRYRFERFDIRFVQSKYGV